MGFGWDGIGWRWCLMQRDAMRCDAMRCNTLRCNAMAMDVTLIERGGMDESHLFVEDRRRMSLDLSAFIIP